MFPRCGQNSRKRQPRLDILGDSLREVQLYYSIKKSRAEEETKRNVWKPKKARVVSPDTKLIVSIGTTANIPAF